MLIWLKTHRISFLLLLLGGFFYGDFAWDLERNDFIKLISLYAALFVVGWKLLQLEKYNFWFLALAGLIFRLVFLFSLPNLSPDFYRFLWDGNLLLHGLNPYLQTPSELIQAGSVPFPGAAEMYAGISELSTQNHTNYPPLNQLFFALAALLGEKSVFWGAFFLRLPIIAADLGILYFGRKLLKKLNLPEYRIFWYFLNPLIIIELTGNLHFEGVMLFFLVAGMYLLYQKKEFWSSVLWGCAVSIKLIPLIFLPLLFRRLGLKRTIRFSAVVGGLNLLLFVPFLSSEFLQNYSSSVGLWFQKFEFNASVWYLIREIGFYFEGYNILMYAGPVLGATVFFLILLLAIFGKNSNLKDLILLMLMAITSYLFLATTVHPWYLATPLLLSVFTRHRFVLVWSLVVFLSYFTYSNPDFKESEWLLMTEYLLVFGFLGYELYKNDFKTVFVRKKAFPNH